MTFYDYDMTVLPNGREVYVLRANAKPLPVGKCVVFRKGSGWGRMTYWHSRHGKREGWFATLDEALTSGIRWARRREAEVAR